MKRTFAYWPARIILGAGIIGAGIVAIIVATGALSNPCLSCDRPTTLGLPGGVLLTVLAVTLAVAGLVWIVGIFRGPRDEPPAWRHRDGR